MVLAEISHSQTCYQEKMPTDRTEIHSEDMANSISTDRGALLVLLQVFIAFNMNMYHFLKLKVEESLKCLSNIHYLHCERALGII